MSFIFYGWWDWRFLFLIIGSGLIDYFAGLLMVKYPSHKKILLSISIIGNVGSLMIFKYSEFIAKNIDTLFYMFGINLNLVNNIPPFALILPVGISFYTFQSMSYSIDIYKGEIKPVKNIFLFFSFLSFFPQLVAGPIVRAKDFIPQLLKYRNTNELERWNGMKLIVTGYFKKVVIADNIAPIVNKSFENPYLYNSSLFWWITMIGFALQIYCDFSGYSDIARGLAKWMGYHFRINFNHPYISTSIKEFWTRWHISLSSWFRDYVYIPLGGSKSTKLRSHINMWITMLISGLWHGANYTFIVWGALHSLYVSFERIIKLPQKLLYIKGGTLLSLIITNFLVIIAWVFFRSQNINDALYIIKNMLIINLNSNMSIDIYFKTGLTFIIIGILIELYFFLKNKIKFKIIPIFYSSKLYRFSEVIYLSILTCIIILLRGKGMEFIYFQF